MAEIQTAPVPENPLGGDARFDELMKRLRMSDPDKPLDESEWEEVERFIRQNLISPEAFGMRLSKEFESGRSRGREEGRTEVIGAVNRQAADLFIADKDADAKLIRDLAKKIKG